MNRIKKKLLSNLNPSTVGLSAYARFILTMLISLMHIDRFVQMGTTIPYTQREKKPMWLNKAKSQESADRSYIVYLDLNCIILFPVNSNGIEKIQSMRIIEPSKGSDIEN